MKSEINIKFDEKSDKSQIIKNLLQLRNKISVFNDNVIKFLIIHIYLNIFLRFIYKNH